GAELTEMRDTDRMRKQAGRHAARATPGAFFEQDYFKKGIALDAAIRFGKTDLQQSGIRGLFIQRSRKLSQLVPFIRKWEYLRFKKTADRASEILMFWGVIIRIWIEQHSHSI